MIGIKILVIALLLSGCVQTRTEYIELKREDITCQNYIKTPLDMAKCLQTYMIKYRGVDDSNIQKVKDERRKKI